VLRARTDFRYDGLFDEFTGKERGSETGLDMFGARGVTLGLFDQKQNEGEWAHPSEGPYGATHHDDVAGSLLGADANFYKGK
jgi:hypothetical protein